MGVFALAPLRNEALILLLNVLLSEMFSFPGWCPVQSDVSLSEMFCFLQAGVQSSPMCH